MEIKMVTCIMGHLSTYCIDFDKFSMLIVFLTGIQKRYLVHYSLWNRVLRSMLVFKCWFWFNSNLVLHSRLPFLVLYFHAYGRHSFFYRIHKMSYIMAYRLKIFVHIFKYLNIFLKSILVLLNYLKYVFRKSSKVSTDFF